MASHAPTLSADRTVDVFRGVGGEVRQAAVLQVAPEELHRVQIRGVWRKPDDATARMSGEPGAPTRGSTSGVAEEFLSSLSAARSCLI